MLFRSDIPPQKGQVSFVVAMPSRRRGTREANNDYAIGTRPVFYRAEKDERVGRGEKLPEPEKRPERDSPEIPSILDIYTYGYIG